MAVVFISPKKRQRTFLMMVALASVALFVIIFVGIIFSKPQEAEPTLIFNSAKVNINTSMFGSEIFQTLQPFPSMDYQYAYKATTKSKQLRSGFVSAESSSAAKAILEDKGLTVTSLELLEIGRDNPFVPYYEIPKAPVQPTTPPAEEPTTPPES